MSSTFFIVIVAFILATALATLIIASEHRARLEAQVDSDD